MLRSFQIFICAILVCSGLLVAACASRSPGEGPRYPPRRPGCALSIFHGELPEVVAWDDIGKIEITCHIDDTEVTCLNRLRAEACRMGGDMIYRLPRKPWSPPDQTMGYTMGFRGIVAHRRGPPAKDGGRPPAPAEEAPPPATAEEAAGPVVPLTGPGAPPLSTADGGVD